MRSVERAVYSRSAWKGVHSSKTRAMSEPSAAWTCIETSGEMNSSEPSRGERKRAPSSLISTLEPCSPPERPLPLTSLATPPWASEKTWKPPESVISARSQPMKPCRPPAAAIRSGPGETKRW